MKIIDAGFEIIENSDIRPMQKMKKIEQCGRVCYKSEDKITDDSCKKFVENIIKRGHESVLEHDYYVLKTDEKQFRDYFMFSKVIDVRGMHFSKDGNIISGNIRAFRDFYKEVAKCKKYEEIRLPLEFFDDYLFDSFLKHNKNFEYDRDIEIMSNREFQQLSAFERIKHERATVKFTVDRGVSHELVRHRVVSFSQESTRYCNYSHGKFGEELTFIRPLFFEDGSVKFSQWEDSMRYAESIYLDMVSTGATPQEARSVLPNSLKTEIVVTATVLEWFDIFVLRTSKAAHPQMREVMIPLLEEFKERYSYFDVIQVEE